MCKIWSFCSFAFCSVAGGSKFSCIGGGCVRDGVFLGLPRPRLATGAGGAGGEGAHAGASIAVLRGRPRPRFVGVAGTGGGVAAREAGDEERLAVEGKS